MIIRSQRILLEVPELAHTFAVRSYAPDALLFANLFANLGAVQLNYGCGLGEVQKLVDLIEANALILHLNPLQECVQSEGDRNFKGLLSKISAICLQLPVPVIVKEVGNGVSKDVARQLIETGVTVIDVSGTGGTSWAKVEGERAADYRQKHLGNIFAEWELPVDKCLLDIRKSAPEFPLIASGGVRTGVDVCKAVALGANLVGMASPFIKAASHSEEQLRQMVNLLLEEVKTTLFCIGVENIQEIQEKCLSLFEEL